MKDCNIMSSITEKYFANKYFYNFLPSYLILNTALLNLAFNNASKLPNFMLKFFFKYKVFVIYHRKRLRSKVINYLYLVAGR